MFAGIIVMMGVFNMIEQHTIGLPFLQNAQTIMKIVYFLTTKHISYNYLQFLNNLIVLIKFPILRHR
jgi:hypothetical protein